jgi:uncharacterized protein YfaT (DUF1175 family)
MKMRQAWFVSRDLANASPGDLLFFKPDGSDAEHVMIYVGASQILPSARRWIVYVTDAAREVQKVSVEDSLVSWPPAWRADPANKNFLGVWRLNILRDSR